MLMSPSLQALTWRSTAILPSSLCCSLIDCKPKMWLCEQIKYALVIGALGTKVSLPEVVSFRIRGNYMSRSSFISA